MQLEFIFNPGPHFVAERGQASGKERVPMVFVRHPRARRYVLRLRPDGVARVTIPRGGSAAEARRFVERHRAWLERELQRLPAQSLCGGEWRVGTRILLRGEPANIVAAGDRDCAEVRLGAEWIAVTGFDEDLRPAIERHLWGVAARELPPRVEELAAAHRLSVRGVVVRNQRSRWGSCSRRGVISLNWRLVQMPPFVSDYIILHELMHLREMNHSPRYWRQVAQVCPDYLVAERWLKTHSKWLSRPS